MGFVGTLLSILGFGFGIPIGLVLGFILFVYSKPKHAEYPGAKPLSEISTTSIVDFLPVLPLWVKSPDYERIDWFNRFLSDMWPYLDKAICGTIQTTLQPMFDEYSGKFLIETIKFQNLSLGTLPPSVQGMKVLETNEKGLLMEPVVRWAGNPNIVLVIKLSHLPITVQLVDLQIFAILRIALKPLVPTFPCFAMAAVSLLDKPFVDFGLKILGGDVMSIPGVYHLVQKGIKKQVAGLYLWPQTLELPILDASTLDVKKPVGLLHVKVIGATGLLRKDVLGKSDPYVKLSLSGEKLPGKKTTIKKRNLNPEWNEDFRLIVKDPKSQILQLEVFDWDKVGGHDRLGVRLVPLEKLQPCEKAAFDLELLKNAVIDDPRDKKRRGRLAFELTYIPFREDSAKSPEHSGQYERKESNVDTSTVDDSLKGGGLLSVAVQGAREVEGKRHSNPYAVILFRGEKRQTKMMRRTREPLWNDEFQFALEEAPLNEKIWIEVMSKQTGFRFRTKESLGYVEINLYDVVFNGRINQKYHLVNSRNGIVHVEIGWTAA